MIICYEMDRKLTQGIGGGGKRVDFNVSGLELGDLYMCLLVHC